MPLAGNAAALAHQNTQLVAQVLDSLSTRTLNHFAQEARLDGESLAEAVQRYEIDYAWHVLGSARLRDETVSSLAAKLDHAPGEALQARVSEVLLQAAQGLAPELLMSFDNDVAEALAAGLFAQLGAAGQAPAAPQPAPALG